MSNGYKSEIFDKGIYGNIFWEYFEDGTLVFKYSKDDYVYLTWKRGETKPIWLEKYGETIRKIIFSEGIRYIGTHYYDLEVRFSECQNLNEIVFPKSLQYIETREAFKNLSVTQMTVSAQIMGRWGDRFAGCHKMNVLIMDTKEVQSDFCRNFQNLKKVILTGRVRYINAEAFKNCKKLEKVEIQGDLFAIDDYVFENCISLREIIFPTTVVWIGNQCFRGCGMLCFVNRLDNLVNIGNDVFEDCHQIAIECMAWHSEMIE